jgi:hypothetical protein
VDLFTPFHLFLLLVIGAFWLWMLVDCLKNPRLKGSDKVVWVLVILVLFAGGGLLYLFFGRNKPA